LDLQVKMNRNRISTHRNVVAVVDVDGLHLLMPGDGVKTRSASPLFVICVTVLDVMSLKPMLPHDLHLAPE
jgi:hypothetical protein